MSPPTAKKRKNNRDEEARLESLVFGTGNEITEDFKKEENNEKEDNTDDEESGEEQEEEEAEPDDDDDDVKDSDSQEEEEAEGSDAEVSADEEMTVDSDDDNAEESDGEVKAAWVDPDDEKYTVKEALKLQHRRLPGERPEETYQELLVNKFQKIHGTPKWAEVRDEDEEDEDDDHEILKQSNHLMPSKSKKLRSGTIDLKAMKNINHKTENEGQRITSLQFHPSLNVAFVGGHSRRINLFKIDGKENNVLDRVYFEKFSISSAKFIKEGNEIIAGSKFSNHCKTYDTITGKIGDYILPHNVTNMANFEISPDSKFIAIAGKRGEIYLLNGITKELIDKLKMNKVCNAMAFTPDSKTLITHGDGGTIYAWDLSSRMCINKAIDDGCLSSDSIAISPNGQFIAAGSNQGIVNIYNAKEVLEKTVPQPLKIVKNLRTSITYLKFNPTSEILALASEQIDNAFKMVHIPSFKVFSNFPTFNTVMHRPLVIDFSPGGGYLGVANDKNKAYLYRLNHYGNY